MHLSVTDASGDSAIIEYLDGKPVIHHGRQYQVMTNSPTYDEQLKLNAKWDNVDKNTDLPGSIQSADRFVRASYYLNNLPQTTDQRQAVVGVFSVMRNVSVPWGVGDPEHPNLSPTYWRSVADSTTKIYYFESALSPNIVWVNLNNINFAPGSGVRAVAVEENYSIIGNIDTELKPAAPVRFLAPQPNPPAPAAPGPGTSESDATGTTEQSKKGFGWWWIPVGLAVVAVVGALVRPLSRRPVEAATLAATRAPIAQVPPATPVAPEPTISDRQTSAADASSIQVTYENNALGEGEQDGTDKSDSVPD